MYGSDSSPSSPAAASEAAALSDSARELELLEQLSQAESGDDTIMERLNRDGSKRAPVPDPQPDLVAQYLSPEHFRASQAYKARKHDIIHEFQQFEHDTGTIPVQLALLTERIKYLTKHCEVHRKEHSSRRGLIIMLSRRRKMLKYLRRTDFDKYVQVLKRLELRDNYYDTGWGQKYRIGVNVKWTPDRADAKFLPPADMLRGRLREKQAKGVIKPVRAGGRNYTKGDFTKYRRSRAMWDMRLGKVKNALRDRFVAAKEYLPKELEEPENRMQKLQLDVQLGYEVPRMEVPFQNIDEKTPRQDLTIKPSLQSARVPGDVKDALKELTDMREAVYASRRQAKHARREDAFTRAQRYAMARP